MGAGPTTGVWRHRVGDRSARPRSADHGPFDEEFNDICRAIAGRVAVIAITHAHAGSARGVPVARVIHHGIDVARMRLLAGARALLNPIAWDEHFGLVMIEALACGAPVLAFHCGAAPEIVDDGRAGFLCDDERVVADRVAGIDRVDRRACRASARNRFSAARMVAEHLELYEQVLHRAAGEQAA